MLAANNCRQALHMSYAAVGSSFVSLSDRPRYRISKLLLMTDMVPIPATHNYEGVGLLFPTSECVS